MTDRNIATVILLDPSRHSSQKRNRVPLMLPTSGSKVHSAIRYLAEAVFEASGIRLPPPTSDRFEFSVSFLAEEKPVTDMIKAHATESRRWPSSHRFAVARDGGACGGCAVDAAVRQYLRKPHSRSALRRVYSFFKTRDGVYFFQCACGCDEDIILNLETTSDMKEESFEVVVKQEDDKKQQQRRSSPVKTRLVIQPLHIAPEFACPHPFHMDCLAASPRGRCIFCAADLNEAIRRASERSSSYYHKQDASPR
jgi:hypothetical protein